MHMQQGWWRIKRDHSEPAAFWSVVPGGPRGRLTVCCCCGPGPAMQTVHPGKMHKKQGSEGISGEGTWVAGDWTGPVCYLSFRNVYDTRIMLPLLKLIM